MSRARGMNDSLGAGMDDADRRNAQQLLNEVKAGSGSGIAGDDHHLHIVLTEPFGNLRHVDANLALWLHAVGAAGGVAKIEQRLFGETVGDGTRDSQSAKAGIEDANGFRRGHITPLFSVSCNNDLHIVMDGLSMEVVMKQFVAEQSFWDLFPDAQIGVVVLQNLKPADEIDSDAQAAIAKTLAEANKTADQYLVSEQISKNPMVAVWREAFQKFRTKKGARCSIENLLKRVLKGNPVGSITPLVDIYNAISLKYALPVGGEDIDTMAGDIRLRITDGGDKFLALGDEEETETLEGELAYIDDEGAICRCWNWRDGERTMLKDDTKNAFLIIESVQPERAEDLRQVVSDLAAMAQEYLGATVFAQEVITADNPTMVIED